MKSYLIAALLVLLITFTPANAENCSCEAKDGSCSASLSCVGGCIAICPSGGDCMSTCVTDEIQSYSRITLKITRGSYKQVASALSSRTGRKIDLVPYKKSEKFNFDFKDYPLWDVLEYVSRFGKLKIDGTPFETFQKIRNRISSGEKISMCIRGASVKNVVSYLSFLSGSPLLVASGDTQVRLSSSLREVSLTEIINRISTQADVKIETKGAVLAQSITNMWTGFEVLMPTLTGSYPYCPFMRLCSPSTSRNF